jgi:hypothetical protein
VRHDVFLEVGTIFFIYSNRITKSPRLAVIIGNSYTRLAGSKRDYNGGRVGEGEG